MPYHGTYDGTIYFNEANHFSIIVVRTQDPSIPAQARNAAQLRGRWHKPGSSLFVAVGHDLPRTSAVELELDGEWVTGKHGCQLQVKQWREIVKQTPEGIRAYLGSGLIKGIGPQLADAIVRRFGADALHVLEHDPERLTEIPGITERKLADIQASYAESRALRDLMSLLGPFQVTPATAVKVYEFFGPTCVEILRSRPYELCRISGFGFKRVDAIIRKTDKRLDTPDRIQGALMYALQEAGTQQGHLYLPRTELLQTAMQLLNSTVPQPKLHLHTDQVEAVLQDAILHGDLVANEDAIYLARVFAREDETARRIARRLTCPDHTLDIEDALTKVKETLGICLSFQQEQAVQAAFHHSLSIITGSPGTGKTTVLRAIIEVFRRLCPDKKLLLMAPTGRASRRMAESTGVTDAKTMHSAMGLGGEEGAVADKKVKLLDADLLIVDEFSMVDMWLAQQMFQRVRASGRIVLVGDPDQLPSVGAGQVFASLIKSGQIPVTVLDQIFRQSKDGLIAYNAKFINEGSTRLYYGPDFQFVESGNQQETAATILQLYTAEIQTSGVENVQILSPFRSRGEASADLLNLAIREQVNPFRSEEEEIRLGLKVFRVGDRVMQTKNTEKVSNGDLGFVRGIETHSDGKRLLLDFGTDRLLTYRMEELANLDLAYATTIHKAMGSEFETVIVPVIKPHAIMLYRNLLYTAITRAKKKVILVGQKSTLFLAVHKADISKRNTRLAERIQMYCQVLAADHTARLPEAV